MMLKPSWYDYATYDNDGFINGIKDDAPDEAKEAYKEYIKEEKKAEKENVKI